VVKRLFATAKVLAVIACVIGPNVGYAITSTDYNSIVNDTPLYDANDGCASGTAGTGAAAQGDNNATIAYSYLVGQGMSTAGAAGIVGNMIEESGVGPERLQSTVLNQVTTPQQVVSLGLVDNSVAGWGIVQWTPPDQIITGTNPSASVGTLYYQLAFFWNEFSTKYASTLSLLKSDTSPVQAATDFLNGFEKGSPSALRLTNAQAIYNYEVNHTPLPASVLGQIVSGAAANAGTPGTGLTGGGCGSSSTSALTGSCANPIRDVKGLIPLRVDQGVDYEGTGPVYPICDSTIYLVEPDGSAGWPGDGSFIAYKVNGNSVDGKSLPADTVVYFAEDCVAVAGLHSGQTVTTQQPICNQNEGGTNIETGWTKTTILTSALGGTDPCWNGGSATNYGQNFSALLKALGAPPGDLTRSSGVCTTPLPAGWPTW
jgi:hypothetical protein